MGSTSDASGLRSLDSLIESSVSLLQQLQVALAEIHRDPKASTPDASETNDSPTDAIALARDSAALVRAHTTRLSLLMVNEPFSSKAVIAVLRDLASGPVPGLASSLQVCQPDKYTAVFRKELAWRTRAVLVELASLLQKIPTNGQALSGSDQGFGPDGKGSIALTGVLWSACDDVTKLCSMGVGGFFAQKVKEWTDVLKDTMEELKEWGDEEPEDDEDEDDEDDADKDVNDLADNLKESHISSTQDMLDDLMGSQTIPKSDPEKIRPRLETTLKRIRLVTLLYQAIIKRRIKNLPSLPVGSDASGSLKNVANRLEDVARVLKTMPDRFGDLACAFYELESEEIDSLMEQCSLDAFAAAEILSEGWEGGRDEFSDWVDKFQVQIKKE